MKYKIMIHPMPESCRKCPIVGFDNLAMFKNRLWWCPLLLDEHNDMVEISDISQKLSDCPLIPAEPWQFETCETCGLKNRVLTSNPPQVCKNIMTVKGTCKEWRAK